MRKRRVLAVLLALSLVVSGNGMTVLAAETDADQPVVTTQEETIGTSEESEEAETPDTADESEESETPGTTQDPEESKTPETTENPEDQEDPDAPKEDEGEEPPVEDETADPEEEQPVEDEAEEPAEEPEEAEAALQNYVSRIVTFTDDTGMKVTYDANAATQYHYVVENGVLTGVQEKKTDAEGNETWSNASFEGNVVLEQPEEEEHYTSVAASVFGQNTDITYVKLPMGVETITAGAFKGCTALKGVYLPASVNKIENSAFEGCTEMTQISVPKAVTEIGGKAFKGDAKLHLVHIKDRDYCNLETIGESAFEGCATLAEFCSDTSFVVPVKLKTIGESAFKGCTSIKKVDFTDTDLSTLGIRAFEGCTGLTDLNMGDRISVISQYAFAKCSGLMSLIIQDGDDEDMVIDSYAFKDCFRLKQLVLPQSVSEVRDYAFQGCTNLGRVEVHNFTMKFGENEAFPSTKLASGKRLFIVDAPRNNKRSSGELYASTHSEAADWEYFDEGKDPNKLYGCVIEGEDPEKKDGKITGGKIWVQNESGTLFKDLNGGKGVPSDNKKYYIYYQAEKDFVLVSDSLRCNGEPVQKDDQKRYYFTMPVGGVIITAEFTPEKTDKIVGKSVTVEFSNGEPTDRGVSLKVGQTTRMFLIDESGEAIPSSKIQSIESRNPKVATVTKSGVITAVGTNGRAAAEAEIVATVNGEDGLPIPISQKIIVVDAEAGSIALKAITYPLQIVTIVQSAETNIQTASVKKDCVAKSGAEITLKANVYTVEQENISKDLIWTTSNAKVAKLSASKTEGKNPINVVEIQKDCEGEATITVTATNPTDGANKKVTQKFVIQVYQKTYKLATTSLTVNPNAVTGGELEVISSYGQDVSDASIQLYREEKDAKTKQTILIEDTNFVVRPQDNVNAVGAKKFNIEANSRTTIVEKTYNLKVGINGKKETLFPLTITVKRSTPNPTVKFNTNKAKFNLFYKNGGTTSEGEQMSLLTEITKLGDAKVKKVALEPLNKQKEDDKLFAENFVIDEVNTDLTEGKVVIKRSAAALQYTTQKKAAVTGNLVLYFDGYDDSAVKRVKVTMPICTTAPSWALRTTTGTYRDGTGMQDVSLELYDKKSKTKEQVILDNNYKIEEENGDISFDKGGSPKIADSGAIAMRFLPDNEKMKLVLTNSDWERDQNGNERNLSYIYTVRVSIQKPVIKTDKNAVSLNLNYPEKAEEFDLVSNLGGVKIEPRQTFTAEKTRSNESEIEKLSVTYENGKGKVSIKPNETIKKGTYKFKCTPNAEGEEGLKAAVLTVKVVDTRPTVKMGKGTLQLNKVVYMNNSTANDSNSDSADDEESMFENARDRQTIVYRETSERTFKVSGKPEGYTLAPVGSGANETEILGTTRNKTDAVQHFEFSVEEDSNGEKDDILRAALKDASLTDGTYTFKMTPRYLKAGMKTVSAQPVTFQVKVINTNDITLTASAKGKINLVNREGETNDKNGIVYTPVLKNVIGEIEEVKIYDTSTLEESEYFDICMIEEGKDAGKFFVTPKKIAKTTQNEGDPIEYTYVELDNNKSYTVCIWVKVKGYAGNATQMGGVRSKNIKIKTAQVLPKVTLNKTSMDVYLSTKNYNADFIVKPKEGSVGTIEDIYFGEKDEMANDSFELIQTPQADGSMKVTVHLKEAVSFANGANTNIKFYVKYKGQGTNTSETATGFTMKIRVN